MASRGVWFVLLKSRRHTVLEHRPLPLDSEDPRESAHPGTRPPSSERKKTPVADQASRRSVYLSLGNALVLYHAVSNEPNIHTRLSSSLLGSIVSCSVASVHPLPSLPAPALVINANYHGQRTSASLLVVPQGVSAPGNEVVHAQSPGWPHQERSKKDGPVSGPPLFFTHTLFAGKP